MNGLKRLNLKIDAQTHKALKRMALEQDSTMQEVVLGLIKQIVYPKPQVHQEG